MFDSLIRPWGSTKRLVKVFSLCLSLSLPLPRPLPPSSSQYISLWPVFQSGASMQIKYLRSAANNLWNCSCTSSHSCRSMVAITSKGNHYFKHWLTVNISLSEHCNTSKALCEGQEEYLKKCGIKFFLNISCLKQATDVTFHQVKRRAGHYGQKYYHNIFFLINVDHDATMHLFIIHVKIVYK